MIYRLNQVAGKINFPMLTGTKAMAAFAAWDGADLHYETARYRLRDFRVFDWLGTWLARSITGASQIRIAE